MKMAEYLAAVKAKLGITSDYALAKALKIGKQTASNYARGERIPGPVVAFRVAEILGEQPAGVIADFELERAERDAKEEEADEWKAILKRLASILLVAGLSAFSFPDNSLAASVHVDRDIHRIKRRRPKRRRAGPFDGLLPSLACVAL